MPVQGLCSYCDFSTLLTLIDQLKDELPLVPAIEGSMDGGQSLRCVAMREDLHEDPRTFTSSYLIGEEDVDRFKHDVKPRPPRKKKNNVRRYLVY